MSATVEAIVGAAYVDGGTNAATTVVESLGVFDGIQKEEAVATPEHCGPAGLLTGKRKLSEVQGVSEPESAPKRIMLESCATGLSGEASLSRPATSMPGLPSTEPQWHSKSSHTNVLPDKTPPNNSSGDFTVRASHLDAAPSKM